MLGIIKLFEKYHTLTLYVIRAIRSINCPRITNGLRAVSRPFRTDESHIVEMTGTTPGLASIRQPCQHLEEASWGRLQTYPTHYLASRTTFVDLEIAKLQ